ncbi:MAG: septum site-determining protein MinC [Microcoleaceae cyanobacterium]
MTSDNPSNPALPPPSKTLPLLSPVFELQVRFKVEGDHFLLFLPTDSETETSQPPAQSLLPWTELLQQLQFRINAVRQKWQPGTAVHLMAGNRLLDSRQLQDIVQTLAKAKLNLTRVQTSRRQTAVTAATAGYCVDQYPEGKSLVKAPSDPTELLADPLYLKMTLRSGVEIRHPGSVVVMGDVNPGSLIMAHGDIMIWGRLRGTVHAGAHGDSKCWVMALQMQPTLIRIADLVARGPEDHPSQFYPEVAYITTDGIRISRASEMSKIRRGQL